MISFFTSNSLTLNTVREWRREPVLSEAEGWATGPPTITWAAYQPNHDLRLLRILLLPRLS
jgi:hypothetical protein